jgi:hypothetical protein
MKLKLPGYSLQAYIKITVYLEIISLFLPLSLASAMGTQDAAFKGYINDITRGEDFQDAIEIDDICDYSGCKTRECAEDVLERTIFRQEYQYVSDKYGTRGKDWDIAGGDEVNYYTLTRERYYDDLAIEIFATGQEITLHFDVSSPVKTFQEKYQ